MPIIRAEVESRLRALRLSVSHPTEEDLREVVQGALEGLDLRVIGVSSNRSGGYTAKWQRNQGVLTEETDFVLQF